MSPSDLSQLEGMLRELLRPETNRGTSPVWRRATVTAVDTASGTVELSLTADAPVTYLPWYAPQVGDDVECLQQGTDWLVLGASGGSVAGGGSVSTGGDGSGTPGQAATVTIGSVTAGAPGSGVTVTNSGTSTDAVLNFSIAVGRDGTDGEDGTDGAPGAAATIDSVSVTMGPAMSPPKVVNNGTSEHAELAFTLPKATDGITPTIQFAPAVTGDPGTAAAVSDSVMNGTIHTLTLTIPRGKDGSPGAANTLAIGSVATLPAGSNATATVTGTAPNQTLSLGIPKGADGAGGDKGADGRDAGGVIVPSAGGLYFSYPTAAGGSGAGVAGLMGYHFMPISLSQATSVQSLWAVISAIGSGSWAIGVGLYDLLNGYPGQLLVNGGATAAFTSAGLKELTLGASVLLPSGIYCLGMTVARASGTGTGPTFVGRAPVGAYLYSSVVPAANQTAVMGVGWELDTTLTDATLPSVAPSGMALKVTTPQPWIGMRTT